MISVESATVRHGVRPALSDVDLTLPEGGFTLLLGRNGSGKTTLLRLLAGLEEPSGGRVTVAGHPPGDPATRRLRGFLPADPPLYDYLTVREQITLVARLYECSPRAVLPRVDGTVLADRLDALVRELSLGMRKQLGLITATVHDPALLLLDEPTNALDAASVAALRATTESWRAERRTVLLCTHDLGWADGLADRLVVLDRGRVTHDLPLAGESAVTALRRLDPANALARPTTPEGTTR